MKKAELIELYQQVEQMCGGSQEQAKRMEKLVRANIPLNFAPNCGLRWDPTPHVIKNGRNIYRSIQLLEAYGQYGSNIEAAWRPILASINYWNRRDKEYYLPQVLPLREGEIVTWEPKEKGEVS